MRTLILQLMLFSLRICFAKQSWEEDAYLALINLGGAELALHP